MDTASPEAGTVSSSMPLAVPDEVLNLIVRRSSDCLLLVLRATCRGLRARVSDDSVWKPRTQVAWHGKLPALLQQWQSVKPFWRVYFSSLKDGTRRQLTSDELSQPEFWCIRFKAEGLRALGVPAQRDPWWRGDPPIKLRLTSSGNVLAVTDARPFYGSAGHVSGNWHAQIDAVHGTTIVEANRQPPYRVHRHAPTWGVYMESCWAVWTAFEMPPRGEAPELEDEALHVTADDPTQQAAIARCNSRMSSVTLAFY